MTVHHAKARRITATDPVSGMVFSRFTNRDYSHVVVADYSNGTFPICWAGRPDLAQKALSRESQDPYRRSKPEFICVRLVMVDSERRGR